MKLYSEISHLIKTFAGQANTLTIPAPYISYTRSLECALLLSQCIYWSDRTKDPEGWFYKTYPEWEEEIHLAEYKVRKHSRQLQKMGVLELKIKKVNGAPTLHFRIDSEKLAESFLDFLQNGNLKDSRMESAKFKESNLQNSQVLNLENSQILSISTKPTTKPTHNKSASGREDFASLRSDPSEPEEVSATPPVEKQVPVNSTLVEASQVAEDQFSAAALSPNFSKIEKPRDHFAERCQHPGHKYPQLIPLGLGHVWVGPGWTDFLPELVEACCRHLKKLNHSHEYGDGQRWITKRIQGALWGEIELMLQEMHQHLERQASNPVAIAPVAAEPPTLANHNPFGVPTTADEEAERIRGMAIAAKAAGRPLSPAILKRAQELGIELGNVPSPAPSVSPIGELPPIPPQPVQAAIAPEPPKLQSLADLQSLFGGLGLSMSLTDTSEILAEIDVVQRCLGWSQAELDCFVEGEFKVRSTHHLEDEELERLLKLLKTQQLVGGAA
uniref:hypothetical protein n=1 Tax=Trichocoleus desertorum TaxID=1481672 RepID=UPI0025B5267F|nr:hypothetical protein [Trichocoleus desertorum]